MLESVFTNKNLLRILLAGWIIGAPYSGSEAADDCEKSLKRLNDGVTNEEPPLKKQKADSPSGTMDVIDSQQVSFDNFHPLTFEPNLLRHMASYLEHFDNYLTLKLVNKTTNAALNDGMGIVYTQRFNSTHEQRLAQCKTIIMGLANTFQDLDDEKTNKLQKILHKASQEIDHPEVSNNIVDLRQEVPYYKFSIDPLEAIMENLTETLSQSLGYDDLEFERNPLELYKRQFTKRTTLVINLLEKFQKLKVYIILEKADTEINYRVNGHRFSQNIISIKNSQNNNTDRVFELITATDILRDMLSETTDEQEKNLFRNLITIGEEGSRNEEEMYWIQNQKDLFPESESSPDKDCTLRFLILKRS